MGPGVSSLSGAAQPPKAPAGLSLALGLPTVFPLTGALGICGFPVLVCLSAAALPEADLFSLAAWGAKQLWGVHCITLLFGTSCGARVGLFDTLLARGRAWPGRNMRALWAGAQGLTGEFYGSWLPKGGGHLLGSVAGICMSLFFVDREDGIDRDTYMGTSSPFLHRLAGQNVQKNFLHPLEERNTFREFLMR